MEDEYLDNYYLYFYNKYLVLIINLYKKIDLMRFD